MPSLPLSPQIAKHRLQNEVISSAQTTKTAKTTFVTSMAYKGGLTAKN